MASPRRRPHPSSDLRDWSQLPTDALLVIFHKVGVFDVVAAAEKVCRPWRAVAKHEPVLWRRVNTLFAELAPRGVKLEVLARVAVDRADGQLEAFWGDSCCDIRLLMYMATRNKNLKSLRLLNCSPFSTEELVKAVKHIALLEELELTHVKFVFGEMFEQVGHACPQLKHFRLNFTWWVNPLDRDKEAMAIAKSMPKLRHLQLFCNQMTNKGLAAILDNCPHLEMLDIRHCSNVEMNPEMLAKCANIKTLRLPHDSTGDYRFMKGTGYCSDGEFSNDGDYSPV